MNHSKPRISPIFPFTIPWSLLRQEVSWKARSPRALASAEGSMTAERGSIGASWLLRVLRSSVAAVTSDANGVVAAVPTYP
jgi:hypothetical protein